VLYGLSKLPLNMSLG
jgi:hypothetical protein